MRTGIGSALYFSSLNALRQRVAKSQMLADSGLVENTSRPGRSSSSLPRLSNVANLTTGALARASVGLVMMPITVIKVRYESSLYTYESLIGAGRDIYRHEGLRGFFSGFGATAVRDAPYAGLYVVFYEQCKQRLSQYSSSRPAQGSSSDMKRSTSAGINFVSGIIAAGLATAITNPFDAVKTRIQLMPRKYGNMFAAARLMVREDGPKVLLDGLGLRMGRKAISSALAWTLYEELIKRAEEKWETD
jgi:solute carrier family 25 protein 38